MPEKPATGPSGKFPYIILPSLSSSTEQKPVPSNVKSLKSEGTAEAVKKTTPDTNGHGTKLPAINTPGVKTPDSPGTMPSSKGLSRHIALSKQYSSASASLSIARGMSPPSAAVELQAAQAKVLLAHREMRKSPRSFYPSEELIIGKGEAGSSAEDEFKKASRNLSLIFNDSQKAKKQLSLETMARMFPNRVQGSKSPDQPAVSTSILSAKAKETLLGSEVNKTKPRQRPQVRPELGSKSETGVSKELRDMDQRPTMDYLPGGSGEVEVTQAHLRERVEGLTVHVKDKDLQLGHLKQDLIDLQLLVLKEKSEADRTKTLVLRLTKEITELEEKLGFMEKKVSTQEKSILNKLLLIDSMNSTDSDSESEVGHSASEEPFSKACPAWTNPSTQSLPTKLTKGAEPPPCSNSRSTQQIPSTSLSGGSGVGILKECMNWIPIAPDFDKLLSIISLLNYRMDRNQSMKMSQKGNTAQFKNPDTLNLTVFKNGMVLGNKPFRSYATLSVIKLINEMFGGYFPSELHTQYPDGVVFTVQDKRFIANDTSSNFFGPGNKLGSGTSTPLLLPGMERVIDCRKIQSANATASSSVSSLSNGSSLFSLSGSNDCLQFSPMTLSPSQSCLSLPNFLSGKNSRENKSESSICLKFKDTSTGQSYRMRASTTASVEDILSHLEKHLAELPLGGSSSKGDVSISSSQTETTKSENPLPQTKYDLVLPIPHGILTSGNATLEDYGLVQNSLLYIKPVSSTTPL